MLRAAFKQVYASPRSAMKIFVVALVIVMTCIAMSYYVNGTIAESLQQELAMLGILLLGGINFIIALSAYLCMLMQRLKKPSLIPTQTNHKDSHYDR